MFKSSRKILNIFTPSMVPEGQGAQVIRIIGGQNLKELNPFIMLDFFHSKLPAGFPDHPHRGFETVSYVLEGSICHEDFKGHSGTINAGDVQWMTAGRGILHSEMPGSFDVMTKGFQLWINLEKKFKMCEPQYQEFTKEKIPTVTTDGVEIKLIAGQAVGVSGPVYARTPAFYMDVRIQAGKSYEQIIPLGWNGLAFVYQGEGKFGSGEMTVHNGQAFVLDIKDKNENLKIQSDKGVKFILIAGEKIDEPIVQHGPFVMNTKQEIQQTIQDYQNQMNGFEGAHSWKSKIRDMNKRPKA